MNNVATPTVASPIINMQGLITPPIMEIPKVTCVADARQYPSKAGSEDVLFDQNDPDIAYFRRIDSNGFVQVDRRRCISEPEPTQEELNDQRYLSRQEFAEFMAQFQSFREEMNANVRAISAAAGNKSYGNTNNKSYNKQHSGNQNSDGGSQTVQ